jgi:proteasome lid subunit RPN8/RPN11
MREQLLSLQHQLQRFTPDDPYERCGFIWSRRYGTPFSLREVLNTHPEPETNFRIDSGLVREALKTYSLSRAPGRPRSIVGVFHTHPGRGTGADAHPSANDFLAASRHPQFIWVIWHPYTRRLTAYADHGVIESFHLKARWVSRKGI